MKAVLALLCLIGAMLRVDASCSAVACALGTSIIGDKACETYRTYIDCLENQNSTCTDSSADQVASTAIAGAIDVAKAAFNLLSACDGSGRLTVSMFSLLLPVLIAFFKP